MHFIDLELAGFICNVLFQHLPLRYLRVSVIHHFVQKFIGNYEVVSKGLLFEFIEVLSQDFEELVEVGKVKMSISGIYFLD